MDSYAEHTSSREVQKMKLFATVLLTASLSINQMALATCWKILPNEDIAVDRLVHDLKAPTTFCLDPVGYNYDFTQKSSKLLLKDGTSIPATLDKYSVNKDRLKVVAKVLNIEDNSVYNTIRNVEVKIAFIFTHEGQLVGSEIDSALSVTDTSDCTPRTEDLNPLRFRKI